MKVFFFLFLLWRPTQKYSSSSSSLWRGGRNRYLVWRGGQGNSSFFSHGLVVFRGFQNLVFFRPLSKMPTLTHLLMCGCRQVRSRKVGAPENFSYKKIQLTKRQKKRAKILSASEKILGAPERRDPKFGCTRKKQGENSDAPEKKQS